jgi:hypothetical protein
LGGGVRRRLPVNASLVTCLNSADFGAEKRIVEPAFRLVDTQLGGHDVVVASQHDGHIELEQCCRVGCQALEPAQLVVELRPGCRIAIGKVEAPDEHAVDRRFNIAAVDVRRVAR